MIVDFSSVPLRSLIGRLARVPLRLIPAQLTVRILQGPARGMRWVAGAATHGSWLGSYECLKQQAIRDSLDPGDVFWDVGANAGLYSLIAARAVTAGGHVVAIEPLPENVTFLRRHLALNELHARVTIVEAAAGDRDGRTRFADEGGRSMGHISAGGRIDVRLVTIDSLVAGGLPAPAVMKLDVEGAEAQVLQGAERTLAVARPRLFLATHGDAVHRTCLGWLRARAYEVRALDDRDATSSDELVARAT
jgi:FkbM family methyltransferase